MQSIGINSVKTMSLSGLVLSMLVGCALEQPLSQEQADARQKGIESQYAAAVFVYKHNMAPLAQHFVKVCAPQADREYLECIHDKRREIAALDIYPESRELKEQRAALEQQLLDGKIDRPAFRSQLEALKASHDAERLKQDISVGVYHGNY